MTSYWSYVDVLAYALALNAPEQRERFTADPSKWHQAVYEIRQTYGADLPEAFRHIFFDTKAGQAPYSAEVDHFLHVLAQARLMSGSNPAFLVLEMNPSQKATITRLNQQRLAKHRELLRKIGGELSSRVRQQE